MGELFFEIKSLKEKVNTIIDERRSRSASGLCGWIFDRPKAVEIPRSIFLKAQHKWYITTFDHQGKEITLPMADGEYILHFPPGSVNLSAIVIDPDPGDGEGGGTPII